MRFFPRGSSFAAGRALAAAVLGAVAMLLALSAGAGRALAGGNGEAEELKAAWQAVIDAAYAGDEAKVQEFLEKTTMKEEDFIALFKDEAQAKELAARYQAKFAKRWAGDAKDMIARIKEKGFDRVVVVEVTAAPAEQTPEDKKLIPLLKEGTKMYTVHLVKGDAKKGRRYDAFFKVNDRWVTGLKLANLLGSKE